MKAATNGSRNQQISARVPVEGKTAKGFELVGGCGEDSPCVAVDDGGLDDDATCEVGVGTGARVSTGEVVDASGRSRAVVVLVEVGIAAFDDPVLVVLAVALLVVDDDVDFVCVACNDDARLLATFSADLRSSWGTGLLISRQPCTILSRKLSSAWRRSSLQSR